jgi:hypothetical protein
MSTLDTSTTSLYTKTKILSEFVGAPNKTAEQENFIRKYGGGCYLAYYLYNGYFSIIEKGLEEIDEAWENLLSLALGQDIWNDEGDLLPEFASINPNSISEL